MSKKFSFIITVDDNGKLGGKVYPKEDAQKCIDEFNKIRENGKEAYLFQHPIATKFCKSQLSRDQTDKFVS